MKLPYTPCSLCKAPVRGGSVHVVLPTAALGDFLGQSWITVQAYRVISYEFRLVQRYRTSLNHCSLCNEDVFVHTVILQHSYLGALRQLHAMSGLQRFQTVQGNAILLRDPCKRTFSSSSPSSLPSSFSLSYMSGV